MGNHLFVAPHPDDEVLGCGGSIARHADEGDEVHVLIVTRGFTELYSSEGIASLRKEMRSAHSILGVTDVHELDFPAPRLDTIPVHEIADSIREIIASIKPVLLYLPHRGDIHIDHQIVFNASLVAARPISTPVRQILCYETLSETEWGIPSNEHAFIPNVFTSIADQLDRKLAALREYKSQMKELPHARTLESVRALALLRGSSVGLHAAEAFMLIRSVQA